MAYNTKPIITDIEGNPISQYYNKELDKYEPVEGNKGANKVIIYNADGSESNISLLPILGKLSQLTGTVIDEETRKSNELQRIEFYNQLQQMLADGELKGDTGEKGDTGKGLQFNWQGTKLGVKVEGDSTYVYADLQGPQGKPGEIENIDSTHIIEALGYTPIDDERLWSLYEGNLDELKEPGFYFCNPVINSPDDRLAYYVEVYKGANDDVCMQRITSAFNARVFTRITKGKTGWYSWEKITLQKDVGDLTTLNTTDKSNLVNAINEVNDKGVDLTPIEGRLDKLEAKHWTSLEEADLNNLVEPGFYYIKNAGNNPVLSNSGSYWLEVYQGEPISEEYPYRNLIQRAVNSNGNRLFQRRRLVNGKDWTDWYQIGGVNSVNDKTGEAVIDVPDIAGLNSNELALGKGASTTEGGYPGAISIGRSANATKRGIAIGQLASATGLASIAIGSEATSYNDQEGILGATGSNVKTKIWIVPGSFTVKGTKNFEIPHPKPEKHSTHVIRHGAVESPTAGDTLYRWKIKATKENDLVTIDLPDYFIWLNKNVQIWVTGQGHFGNGYGILNRETEQLEIHCQLAGEYNVLTIGTRNDDHQSVQDWDIKGVEREVGESWTGETYVFEDEELLEVEEIENDEEVI